MWAWKKCSEAAAFHRTRWALLVLQVYWFGLLVRAAIQMWKKGGIEDIRSDVSDAEDDKKRD